MQNLKDVPIGANAPDVINAIIEIPRGSRMKVEYDPELGLFRLDRVLYSSVHYPYSYGFIPSTLWGDGDPLDILVFCDQDLFTGLLLEVIPIGALEMTDDKGSDLKIVAVAAGDQSVNQMTEYTELAEHRRLEIEHFFETYKLLEGKGVQVGHWLPSNKAKAAIMSARRNHEQAASSFQP
ncbi:MAG: inorganic diphosphatase [Bacteroidota bacterium]|nr:inorganic diphosphatase [Bacteroidota bacterium]MDP4231795.1 inorganic diphosphatase [Bacteroidota bacterium]MDP4242681.1 inorganic diphosphatase [Bacteroidota bacterium]MDP4287132.1 inorganic diphosphatase [Bacteroidota bacterium]